MRRLFLFVWFALWIATVPGPAAAMAAPDCPMATTASGMAGHDEMDCCKPACAPACVALCPGAVEPSWSVNRAPNGVARTIYLLALSAAPASARLAATDPPPRTTIS